MFAQVAPLARHVLWASLALIVPHVLQGTREQIVTHASQGTILMGEFALPAQQLVLIVLLAQLEAVVRLAQLDLQEQLVLFVRLATQEIAMSAILDTT